MTLPMQAFMPGVHNYRCCPHNYGMAWPYYAENLWHATADKGLAANLYAASEVTAKVGDGTVVTITQHTEYPSATRCILTLTAAKAVAFPLYLRIPGWCDTATVRVNGKPVAAQADAGSYLVVNRTWKTGDTDRAASADDGPSPALDDEPELRLGRSRPVNLFARNRREVGPLCGVRAVAGVCGLLHSPPGTTA